MTGFVAALACEPHAQAPLDIGELRQAAGRVLEDVELLIQLPVEELQHFFRMSIGQVHAVGPALHDPEAGIGRGDS